MSDLSVVLPTKNRPALLGRALASVLPQISDGEVIVVDDGSTPENAAAVRDACARDPRIRLLRNDRSLGPSAARNRGVAVARGRYLSIIDDDNVWLPENWGRQRALLEAVGHAPDVVAVMSVRPIELRSPRAGDRPEVREPEALRTLGELFRRVSPRVFLTTFAIPTALLRQLGGWDERLRWGEHTDLLIRTARVARFAGTDEMGVIEDKQHDHADHRAGRNYAARVEGIRLLLEKHREAFAEDPGLRATYLHVLGVAQLRCGDRSGAMSTFGDVMRRAPSPRRRLRAAGHLVRAALGRPPPERRAASKGVA